MYFHKNTIKFILLCAEELTLFVNDIWYDRESFLKINTLYAEWDFFVFFYSNSSQVKIQSKPIEVIYDSVIKDLNNFIVLPFILSRNFKEDILECTDWVHTHIH